MGRPTPNFHFDGSRQCRLIKKYSEHKWICGDAERKALFCFPCLIFKKSSRSLWTTTGITNVPNLTNHIRKHEKTSDHVTAVTAFSLLGTTDIETSISEASMINRNLHNEEVRRNRNMLQHHIDMVVYLSTQGISFRGHREDATSSNKGNFVEGVKLLAKYSHNGFLSQLCEEGGVFSGLSSDIQNDLIHSIFNILKQEIHRRIHTSKCASILCDETSDITHQSKCSLVLRFVYEGEVFEHLIDLIDVSEDRSAQGLSDKIMESLNDYDIDSSFEIIGQSYDGANVMSGEHNSVSQRMKTIWKYAHFVHCCAHKWNLVCRQACESISDISTFFAVIDMTVNFFRASSKRLTKLSARIPVAGSTRWMTRSKSISFMDKFYEEIVVALEELKSSENQPTTRLEASGILKSLKTPEFRFLLKFFFITFSYGNILTVFLQRTNLDAASVSRKLTDYLDNLQSLRSNEQFSQIWQIVEQLDSSNERSRKANTRLFFDSGYDVSRLDDVNDREKCRALMFEVIDSLQARLKERFKDLHLFDWMSLLYFENFDHFMKNENTTKQLVEHFKQIYPHRNIDTEKVCLQLQVLYKDSDLRQVFQKNSVDDLSKLLNVMHRHGLEEALDDVFKILVVACTIPLTSVQCERSFSALKRIKNERRTSSLHDRTKHLTMLTVEKSLLQFLKNKPDFYDKVIDDFSSKKDRRIKLIYKL